MGGLNTGGSLGEPKTNKEKLKPPKFSYTFRSKLQTL